MQKTLATCWERAFATLQGEDRGWRWEVVLRSRPPKYFLQFWDSAKDPEKGEEGMRKKWWGISECQPALTSDVLGAVGVECGIALRYFKVGENSMGSRRELGIWSHWASTRVPSVWLEASRCTSLSPASFTGLWWTSNPTMNLKAFSETTKP